MSQQILSACPLLVVLLTAVSIELSAALPISTVSGTCAMSTYEVTDPLRILGPETSTSQFEGIFGATFNLFTEAQQYRYRFVNKMKMDCYWIENDIPELDGEIPQPHNLPTGTSYGISNYGYPLSILHNDENTMMFVCHDCKIPRLTANTTHKIATIHSYTFLDLDGSKITEIDANALVNFPQLSVLNLRNNSLRSLPERLFWNQEFHTPLQLSLQHNNFENISVTLCNIKAFEYLNLQDNKISSMKVDCEIKVVKFNMSNNMLESLDLNLLEAYGNLKLLDLSFNRLSKFTNIEGSNFESVEYLLLNDNKLSGIGRRYFRRFDNLQSLILRSNGIVLLDTEVFKDLRTLLHLDLSQNAISNIPFGIFRDVEMLKELNLAGNKLKQLTMQTFGGLTELKYLNLSFNFLKQIVSTDLLQIKQLQALDLSNNQLYKLDAKAILEQHNIFWMAIKNNFWNCRQLLQILQFAQKRNCNVKRGILFDVPNIHGIACSSKNITFDDKMNFEGFLNSLSDEKEMELLLSKLDSSPVDETNVLEPIVNKIKSLVLLIAVLFVVDFIFQWLFRLYQARHTVNIPISTLK